MTCETLRRLKNTRYIKKICIQSLGALSRVTFCQGFLREKFAAPCASKISKASTAIKVIYIHFHRFQRVARIRGMIRPLNLRVGVKFTGRSETPCKIQRHNVIILTFRISPL